MDALPPDTAAVKLMNRGIYKFVNVYPDAPETEDGFCHDGYHDAQAVDRLDKPPLLPHFLGGATTLLPHFLRECSFWAVPSLSLSVMSISSLFPFLILDLETLTTLIPESIPGQTQRCLIAICLSQQVLGKAWQVWHATKSVADAFRPPHFYLSFH